MITPGSTRATRSSGLISRIRFIRSSDTAMPPWMARTPPDFPERAADRDHRHPVARGDLEDPLHVGGALDEHRDVRSGKVPRSDSS